MLGFEPGQELDLAGGQTTLTGGRIRRLGALRRAAGRIYHLGRVDRLCAILGRFYAMLSGWPGGSGIRRGGSLLPGKLFDRLGGVNRLGLGGRAWRSQSLSFERNLFFALKL